MQTDNGVHDNIKEKIEEMNTEMERLKNSIISCYKAYQNGDISREEYIASRVETNDLVIGLDHDIQSMEDRLKETEKKGKPEYDWESILEQAIAGYDGNILAQIIDKVYVYGDGTVEVIFKGNDICEIAAEK